MPDVLDAVLELGRRHAPAPGQGADERVVVAIEPLPGPGPGPVRLDPAEAGFEVDPDVLDHAEFGIGVISGRSIPGHGPGGATSGPEPAGGR